MSPVYFHCTDNSVMLYLNTTLFYIPSFSSWVLWNSRALRDLNGLFHGGLEIGVEELFIRDLEEMEPQMDSAIGH